jgi:uncharacterized membrane protein
MESLEGLYFIKGIIAAALAGVLNYFMPVQHFVAITFCLIFADLVTGLQAAKKRGEQIHSKGLRRSSQKFMMYCFALLSAHGIQAIYFGDFPLAYTVSAYISITEFWSVLENVGVVTGTNVLDAVREKLTEALKNKPKQDGL